MKFGLAIANVFIIADGMIFSLDHRELAFSSLNHREKEYGQEKEQFVARGGGAFDSAGVAGRGSAWLGDPAADRSDRERSAFAKAGVVVSGLGSLRGSGSHSIGMASD